MSEDYTLRDWAEDKPDSPEADSVTAATNERKTGYTSEPSPSDGKKPNDQHSKGEKGGSDRFGIPVQFQS